MCVQRRLRSAWASTMSGQSLQSAWKKKQTKKLWSLAFHWAQSKDWSDWADAQADLTLRWAHSDFFCFVMLRLSFNGSGFLNAYWAQVQRIIHSLLYTTFQHMYIALKKYVLNMGSSFQNSFFLLHFGGLFINVGLIIILSCKIGVFKKIILQNCLGTTCTGLYSGILIHGAILILILERSYLFVSFCMVYMEVIITELASIALMKLFSIAKTEHTGKHFFWVQECNMHKKHFGNIPELCLHYQSFLPEKDML